jgi:cell division protein FtsZ
MTINLSVPPEGSGPDLKPRITVIGVGGAGGNAVNNMIRSQLEGVEFVVANTDAQALSHSRAQRRVQLGVTITQSVGAGSRPDVGRIAAEEALEQLMEEIRGSNMAFIAAGMGGGTGTGAAPVIARAAREQGILTVGVVTKPFHFEGGHRMKIADAGIEELEQFVDTLIIIPNQNLFRVANERTTFADAFNMADDVLHSGVRGVTDLMIMPGLINLDFADIRAVMSEMGKAMMGTGEAEGDRRALQAAEAAISNPLLDDMSMKGARGVLINVTGGSDMTLFEVDEAANRIRSEVDSDAFIIFGSTFDDTLEGRMRVSVVATGMSTAAAERPAPVVLNIADAISGERLAATGASPARTSVGATPPFAAFAGGAMPSATVAELDEMDARPTLAQGPELGGHEGEQEDTGDVFIPPAPIGRNAADRQREPAVASSERGGEPASGAIQSVAHLFARVTGAGRAARDKAESAPEPSPEAPAGHERQRRLGGVTPEDRLPASQPTEDLLDIPAFLRRQAN